MKVIKGLAASILALSALTAQAQSWTVTTTGTVDNGFDTTGVFGMAGQSLAGMSFSQAITVSTNTAYYQGERQQDGTHYTYGWGPNFTDVVTINGHTMTFDVSRPAQGMLMVSTDNAPSPAGLLTQNGADYIGVENEINKNSKDASHPFLTTDGFDQNFALTLDPSFSGYASFSIYDGRVAVFTSQHIETFTVTSTIPEPQGGLMLFAGLTLFALQQRLRARSKQTE